MCHPPPTPHGPHLRARGPRRGRWARTPSLPCARALGALRTEVAVARGLGCLETVPWLSVLSVVCPPSDSGSARGADAQPPSPRSLAAS